MVDQSIIWTALPNGLTGDPADRRLRISVFVAPRLVSTDAQPRLADFPDLLDWPGRLRDGQVAFAVQARATPQDPPGQLVLAQVLSPPPDSGLWAALFDGSTPVESRVSQQPPARPVSSYSVSALHQQLRQGHQALSAASPISRPTLADLSSSVGQQTIAAFTRMGAAQTVVPSIQPPPGMGADGLRSVLEGIATDLFRPDGVTGLTQRVQAAVAHARALATLTQQETIHVIGPAADADDAPHIELARLAAFTRGPVAGSTPVPPPSAAQPLDFSRTLTLLGDHPALLRMLGLVIDLEVPVASVPLSSSSQQIACQLQVLPTFTAPLEGSSVSPWTAYVLEGDRMFSAASDPAVPDIVHGLLDLQYQGEFELVQLDVHGGGLKLINTLGRAADSADMPDSADGGIPSMRTSGVSVARSGQADRLIGRMATSAANDAAIGTGALPVLYAQDLARGYRFDVLDVSGGPWRSLHQRAGTYTFRAHAGGPTTLTVHDEGAVQPAVTQPVPADGGEPPPDAELYIHESLMHWQGWSLAAPRPGKTITDDGPDRISNTAPPDFPQLDIAFLAEPGTLPRLRFGASYRFRARTVDLAGNGLTTDDATALLEVLPLLKLTPPVLPAPGDGLTYRRFEPVISPTLVPRERFGEGESLERLVIRSRTGVGAAQEAIDLTAAVAAARPDASARYGPTAERHVLPPKTSQQSAEAHGLFDASFGAAAGFSATYNMARKEKGSLFDTAIVDVATGESVPVADPGSVETVGTSSAGDNGYVVHHESQLVLPYLPDPMSRAAAFFGLPGVPASRPSGVLDATGQLSFVASALPASALAELGGSAVHIGFGDNWPLQIPFRIVLSEPAPNQGSEAPPAWDPAARTLTIFLQQAGQQTFRMSSSLELADLERLGQWQWVLDMDPSHPPDSGALEEALQGGRWTLTPPRVITLVHAVEQPLMSPEISQISAPRDYSKTFSYLGANIAAHGESTAKLDVLAAWTEAVDPPGSAALQRQMHVLEVPIHLPDETAEPVGDPGVVPVSTYDPARHVVTLQAPSPGDEPLRTYLARHEFGDTKARTVSYSAVASTRFREYFPPEVTQDPQRVTLTGQAVEVMVPSSAPPAAAGLVSVLPTFAWSRDAGADGSQVSRRTGGVRVYLKRPWFSSGDGELLGVILADPSAYPPDDRLALLVTSWGKDPLWGGEETLSPPQPASFPAAVGTWQAALQDQQDGQPVHIAGHQVGYDADRDLLYCDIAVAGVAEQTYAPFLRLALARFQPNALPGMELSPVVLADFVQVPAGRVTTVRPAGAGADTFEVLVEGVAPSTVPYPGLPVEVGVEQRRPGGIDDLAWTRVWPGSDGVDVTADLRWSWRVCGNCRGVVKQGEPEAPCASGGPHSPAGRLALALQPAAADAPGQPGWQMCSRCRVLAFSTNPGSVCPAGGAHNYTGSDAFALPSVAVGASWDEWRRCSRCLGLVLGEQVAGGCAAGGLHDYTGSADYVLDQANDAPGQRGWGQCANCCTLFFSPGSPSPCPADGTHSLAGDDLAVAFGPAAVGDHSWRWCHRCQGMASAGAASSCPAGGQHDLSQSGDYAVVAMPYVRGTTGWRLCSRCQGLAFMGLGQCPAGGDHVTTGSANYVLPVNPLAPGPGLRPEPPLWLGHVTVPADRAPGEYRIVVREFESLPADSSLPGGGRLVFAETVVCSSAGTTVIPSDRAAAQPR